MRFLEIKMFEIAVMFVHTNCPQTKKKEKKIIHSKKGDWKYENAWLNLLSSFCSF